MSSEYLTISERGQITIPQKMRKAIKATIFKIETKGDEIILRPVQTRDDFLQELEESHKEWKEKGGKSLKEIKQKYGL
jgi:bifunctional DNA-binding transcriptional regulator/antitoxin component of YhaV-PrlF toxin-antitoxin module